MMANSPSLIFTIVVFIGCLSVPSQSLEVITADVLPYITQVPCKGNNGNCSLDSFVKENTNGSTFIKTWMLALYFDIEKHSSRDVVAELLRSIYKKLYNHQIVFGRVRCGDGAKRHAVIASFCEKMDPSIIYAYLDGKKTEFWWSVSDFLSHRYFVLGNLLTLQYKWRLDTYTAENYREKMAELWRQPEPQRKHLMVVHVASVSLEVNTTDRVKAFDYLGQVLRNIPDVTVAVATGIIDEGVQFWYIDSNNCPDVTNDEGCTVRKMAMEEWEGRGTDDLLCMLERYSFGLKSYKMVAHFGNASGVRGQDENERRLVKVCPFVLMVYDGELGEDFHTLGNDLSVEMLYLNVMVIFARRDLARDLLDSVGGAKYLGNDSVVMKYHADAGNVASTDYHLANSTTPAGLSVVVKPFIGRNDVPEIVRAVKMDLKKYYVYDSYEDEEPDFNPYVETDELFLLWTNQKAVVSDFFVKLNRSTFLEATAADAKAVVLFFQPWNSASVYSRDLVFPAAANYLHSEFGMGDRLFSVNCFDWNELCEAQRISRYPVVKVFHGSESFVFGDTISVRNVVREALRLGQGILFPKSEDEVAKILNYTNNVVDHVIIAVDIEEEALKELQLASRRRGSEMVIVTKHAALPPHLRKELSKGAVVSFSSRLQPRLVFHRAESSLEQFVTDARRNRVVELSWDLFKEISGSDRPLLVLLVHFMTARLHCLLAGVAAAHRGELFVTWMNARKQHEYAIFRDFQSPELVIRDPVKGSFYRHPINHAYSKDCDRADPVIEKWIQSVLSGQATVDETLQERQYPPSGPFINILDEVYPRPVEDGVPTAAPSEPTAAPDTPDVSTASVDGLAPSDGHGTFPDAGEPPVKSPGHEEL